MSAKMNLELLSILVTLALLLGCDRAGNSTSNTAAATSRSSQPPAASKNISTADQSVLKLLPVDDAAHDHSFVSFRDRLLTAARNRDSAFILNILDPHILNSFGGSGGVEEFKEQWKLNAGGNKLWSTLVTILENGGSFSNDHGKKQFCAPYVTSKWRDIQQQLPKNSDASDYQVIIHSDVALRSGRSVDASLLTTLSYDVVKVISDSATTESEEESSQWVKTSTLAGTVGYVASTDIRSPIDYYACFQKIGSKWVMTALAAGD